MGARTIEIGLERGLIEALARHSDGLTAEDLAAAVDGDPFYTGVWCRAAHAAEVVDRDEAIRRPGRAGGEPPRGGRLLGGVRPGGIFVISDFPFPADPDGLRTVPGRIMSGIQFFEALIGDQLMATDEFVALLEKHGFEDVGAVDVTPVHAVTYGRR